MKTPAKTPKRDRTEKKWKPERKLTPDSLLRKLVKRYFVSFALVGGILLFGLCVRSYIGQMHYARSNVSLNYAEASKGVAPNGTRYNMYSFLSRDLMQTVIDKAALENVSAEELARCVGISTRGSGGSDYISTGYSLSVNLESLQNKNLHIDAKSLLGLLSSAYKQYFYDQYVARADVLLFDYKAVRGYEYAEIADYYQMKLEILQSYVEDRINENSSFRSETTSLTFRDIQERISNLLKINLANVNAYIESTGVYADRDAYLAKLNYLNYRNSELYQRYSSQYSIRLENISFYDILKSAVVMVPTYDQTGQFYMSMTKTGVDDIAKAAQAWNETAAGVKSQIDSIDARIHSVRFSANTPSDREKVTAMLDALENDIHNITELTMLTDSDYAAYKANSYITFTDSWTSASDKTDLKKNAAITFVFCLALCAIALKNLSRKENRIS